MTEPAPNIPRRRLRANLRLYLIPLAIMLTIFLPRLSGGRWGVDTGTYAAVGLAAFNEGDWWSLKILHEPYFNKPPLSFWLLGAVLKAFGTDLWIIRIATLAVAAAAVCISIAIARVLFGTRTALVSGVVLATTLEFQRLTDRPRIDYLLVAIMLAGVWCVVAGAARRRGWLIALSGLPIGLGLLTKPFVAFAALPILAVWLARTGRARAALWLLPAAALALAAAAPWHISMVLLHGDEFTSAYFGRETLHRVSGDAFEPEPWWWYIQYLLASYWPWLLAAVPAALWWARGARHARNAAGVSLAFWWPAVWLVGVSLIPDKHKHYLFPIYPALSWLIAAWAVSAFPALVRRIGRKLDIVVAAALALSIAATIALDPQAHKPMNPDWDPLLQRLRESAPEDIWNAGLSDGDAGMVYVLTGVRAKVARDPEGHPTHPPPGSLAIYNHEHLPPPPDAAVEFQSGKFAIVRLP